MSETASQRKRALITGVTGQDGSYLSELLLSKGYEVHGLVRRSSSFNTGRIGYIYPQEHNQAHLHLHYGDVCDANCIHRLLAKIKPDEIYNLAAQSHVRVSFDVPLYTADATALGALRILDAIREEHLKTKFYQASSSEMFGNVPPPHHEETPMRPRSPYGIAKVFAHNATINYREGYGLFAVSGILFNHESPRRGENFVTRKITISLAEILAGKRDKIYLGNLDAYRDWGYAPEYVEAMWLMMQQEQPENFVIATGETHSVREFLEEAFRLAGLDNWPKYVEIDERYLRPTDIDKLVGHPAKAKEKLGWQAKTKFKDLVRIMLEADCARLGVRLK